MCSRLQSKCPASQSAKCYPVFTLKFKFVHHRAKQSPTPLMSKLYHLNNVLPYGILSSMLLNLGENLLNQLAKHDFTQRSYEMTALFPIATSTAALTSITLLVLRAFQIPWLFPHKLHDRFPRRDRAPPRIGPRIAVLNRSRGQFD